MTTTRNARTGHGVLPSEVLSQLRGRKLRDRIASMRRRWIAVVVLVLTIAIGWWFRGRVPSTSTGATEPAVTTAPAPPSTAPAPALARRPMLPPAIQLSKPVIVRPAQIAAAGVFSGMVVDAETGGGIAGAELTFSRDNGAYSTATGFGGAFRFAPRAAGTYRLVSIEAKGYAPFESEFGRSPVSFTSVAGKDVDGVVLRLVPEGKDSGRRSRGRRADRDDGGQPDAGDAKPPTGSLFGRVLDARANEPIAAFAIAVFRRDGLATRMIAPASFIDPAGSYAIDGLAPGTYEATAMAAGYAWSSYAVVQIGDSPAQADFRLHAGARITGVVIDDATKRPIAGATLSLEGRRARAPDLPVAPLSPEAETGPDGRFSLEHVPPDVSSVQAEKKGYLVRVVSLGPLPEDGDAPPLAIALTPREPSSDASLELTGIGAVLRPHGDALDIRQVVPNGGAADAGLAPGDAILAIDRARVTDLGFEGAIGAIRGREGTTVLLRIRRAGREVDVAVTRKLVRT